MLSVMDKVHTVGMSGSDSTHLTVSEVAGVKVEPPIQVVFEGEGSQVAVSQDALAVRYNEDELCQIGEGNAILGLNLVIGEIAMNGNLERGATKPLHPGLVDSSTVAFTKLPAPQRELTA